MMIGYWNEKLSGKAAATFSSIISILAVLECILCFLYYLIPQGGNPTEYYPQILPMMKKIILPWKN